MGLFAVRNIKNKLAIVLIVFISLTLVRMPDQARAEEPNYLDQIKLLLKHLYVHKLPEEIYYLDNVYGILNVVNDPNTRYYPPDSSGRVISNLIGDNNHVEQKAVVSTIIDENIGYLLVGSFTPNTAKEVEQALREFELGNVQGLILDLRNNHGGLMESVMAVAELLIPASPVTHVYSRDKVVTSLFTSGPGVNYPIVVMINEQTASAAELLAGAIKDNKLGLSVGMRTYGKASIQSMYRLSNGGVFSLTTSHYLTPQGKAIHQQGLKPDYLVAEPEAQLRTAKQLTTGLINRNIDTHRVRNWIFIDVGYKDFYVNGLRRQFQVAPFIQHNITYVPLREVAELLGATVEYHAPTKNIFIENFRLDLTRPVINMQFNVNSPICYVDGRVTSMYYPLLIRDNRAYIHARFLAEQAGAKVYWIQEIQRVAIGF